MACITKEGDIHQITKPRDVNIDQKTYWASISLDHFSTAQIPYSVVRISQSIKCFTPSKRLLQCVANNRITSVNGQSATLKIHKDLVLLFADDVGHKFGVPV